MADCFELPAAPAPRAGRPVRGSRPGPPMMAALDLPGQRWTLCVSWEREQDQPRARVSCDGARREVSSGVLADRLRCLTEAGLAATGEDGRHQLTDPGDAPGAALEPLRAWAARWAAGARQPGTPLDKRICQDKG